MAIWCARATAALMGLVVLFQLLVAAGAPWGTYTQGGANSGSLPLAGRAFALLSVILLVVMASAILARAGEGPLSNAPRPLITVLAWFTTVYSVMGVVLNLITPSASERSVFAPISAAIAVLVIVVMVSTRKSAGRKVVSE